MVDLLMSPDDGGDAVVSSFTQIGCLIGDDRLYQDSSLCNGMTS